MLRQVEVQKHDGAYLFPLVSSPVTLDPYFMGLDGIIFEFTGEPGHVYNLLSYPKIQLDAKFDIGYANTFLLQMDSVIREVGVKFDTHSLLFRVDHLGETYVMFDDEMMNRNETKLLGPSPSTSIRFEPNANYTRKAIRMAPHRVHEKISIRTREFDLDVFAIKYVAPVGAQFHFIDLALRWKMPTGFSSSTFSGSRPCPDGIWGRTAPCRGSRPSSSFPYPDAFEVNGYMVLGVVFPSH